MVVKKCSYYTSRRHAALLITTTPRPGKYGGHNLGIFFNHNIEKNQLWDSFQKKIIEEDSRIVVVAVVVAVAVVAVVVAVAVVVIVAHGVNVI